MISSLLILWRSAPRWLKEAVVLLVAVAAIYVFGDCHGRSVQRQQDTSAEQARLLAREAKMREASKDTARQATAIAAAHTDTLTRLVTRFVVLKGAAPTVLAAPDHDTLHVTYHDGHAALLPVSAPVDTLVHDLVHRLAVADSVVRAAKIANEADSVAIARLWHASVAADSLISQQQDALRQANRALAQCRPSGVGRVVRVVEWAALAYAGAKVYQTLRH